jgi:hypothetical protein
LDTLVGFVLALELVMIEADTFVLVALVALVDLVVDEKEDYILDVLEGNLVDLVVD